MEWTVAYLEKDKMVIAKISGEPTWEQSKKLCECAVALAHKKAGTRFLVDNSKMLKTLSILQVDMLPRMLKDSGVTSKDKIALLFDASSPLIDTHTFFRDTSVIESLNVRNFTEKKEAIAWLKSKNKSPDNKSK